MLPLYELVINDDDHSGVTAVALVDAPAIEVNWMAFNNQELGGEGSGCDGPNCGRPESASDNDVTSYKDKHALDLGLDPKEINITISKTKGNLSAHVEWVKEGDGRYVMSSKITVRPGLSKERAEEIVKHELRHVYQSKKSGFFIKNDGFYWNNELHTDIKTYNKILKNLSGAKTKEQFDSASKVYNALPWEVDANNYAGIKTKFSSNYLSELIVDMLDIPSEINQPVEFRFQTFNNEKRIIAGFLMLANKRIYRNDERGEYDVFFSAPTIERIVNKYHKNQYSNRVNPMHESMLILPDIYMVSDFIVDSTKGINTPAGFDTQPDGSWFGMFKVNNDEIWNEYIKTGIFKGFSVEGFFEDVPVELSEAELKKLSGFLEHLN